MSKNIAQNMYSSQGIINYPTQLHLVGHFCILYHDAWKYEYQVQCLSIYSHLACAQIQSNMVITSSLGPIKLWCCKHVAVREI